MVLQREFSSQTDKMLGEIKVDCVIVMGTCNDLELGIDMREHISNLRRLLLNLTIAVTYSFIHQIFIRLMQIIIRVTFHI